jgi:TPR repeat protein
LYNLALLYKNQDKTELAERYYLLAIDKGDINALNNLAFLYFETNQKKSEALSLITTFYEKRKEKLHNYIKIRLWNGVFDNIQADIEQVIKSVEYEGLTAFLTKLLNLSQTHTVLSLFESEAHGSELKSRYDLIYYATLILAKKTDGNLLLKIPPEVLPTVEDIVTKVKEKQAFYAA